MGLLAVELSDSKSKSKMSISGASCGVVERTNVTVDKMTTDKDRKA